MERLTPAGPPGRRPRGLLLDAMGTLIGLRQPVGVLYAELASRHGLQASPAALDAAFRAAYRNAPPLAFPGLKGRALEQAERHWWRERIESTFAGAGADPPPEVLAHELFDHFAAPKPWLVYPDVPALLERWHGRGLKLAVVSNFDSRLPPLLEALGLACWLDAVVISSAAGRAKPDPGPLRQAMEQLGLEPGDLWHVGDSPEDRIAAAAAGLPCVLVRRS